MRAPEDQDPIQYCDNCESRGCDAIVFCDHCTSTCCVHLAGRVDNQLWCASCVEKAGLNPDIVLRWFWIGHGSDDSRTSGFVSYPGYRNVFSCIKCEMSRIGSEECCCSQCGSFACKHLVEEVDSDLVCFCCLGYPAGGDQWPDWCFTMIFGNKARSDDE